MSNTLVFPQARSDSLTSAFQQFVTLASLEPGKPIERELTANENHSYTVTVAAGQYLLVQAEQRAIDLTLSVSDPSGKKLVETDMFRMGEPESLFFVAETAGPYRLEVKSLLKAARKGQYELKITESRPATAGDSSAVAAEKLVADGVRIEQSGTADLKRKAIEKYQQSIPLWQNAKDTAWEARTLCLIAADYIYLGEKQQSFDFLNRALTLAESAANRSDDTQKREGIKAKAYVLDTTGRANQEFGNRKKALELYNEAMNLSRSVDDRVGEVNSLINLGKMTQLTGDYPKALELSEQARQLVNALGDLRKEAPILNNICMTYQSTGAYEQAFAACNRSVSIARDWNDRWTEGNALNNLGSVYYGTGDYQKTIDLYSQALEVYKSIGYGRGQAMALNNIGYLYATLGDEQKSIDAYNQALEIFLAQGDQVRQATVLNNLALNYSNKGDYRKALEMHLRLLPLRDAATNREGTAVTLENIAECYDHLGEKDKALDYYNQTLTLVGASGDPRVIAATLKNMGALYREQGNYQKALDLLNQARQTAHRAGDKFNEGVALAQIAYVERARANYEEARKFIGQALVEIESLRGSVKSPQLRATFLASARDYYEFQTDVLMRLHQQRPGEGFDAAALAANEQGRARSLLELLAESGAQIRQGVDASLLEREQQLRESISDKAEQQMRLLSKQHTEDAADKAAKEIDALTTDYEQLLARIRQTSPRYAALTQPEPLSLKEIQTSVLDRDTLLLEYALGDERSFLWAVTPTSISTFELPKRELIEAAARHLYELATERNRVVKGETLAQQRARLTRSEVEYQNAATALSNMLLQPAAGQLGEKRLLIVADSALQYVPFASLPAPSDPKAQKSYHPLVLDHEVVNLPSASVMAVLRQETAGRERAPRTLAVLADPVFQRDDPRINQATAASKAKPDEPSNEVYRSAKESGLEGFVRLRFTRNEANEIARLADPEKRFEALDFEASRANATSAALGQYQIVHFATHGLINNRHPELSGIVLSLVDERGQPQNGFLRLYEIYNLKLAADLVVLSACQTALGEEIKGEGLMGLTRGFMYAGSPRVVATLWQVDDRATSEMMKRFYEKMLGEGLRPAAALQAAQVSMQADSRWRSPHYWAAFTLQGEWK
ncbi:MAG TPA: CHAT domain-containing protein [Pyrinomonadaceae bacterium]|nr:CHAT domain-containing protein [Pyrinomonadaceae bacterium]